MVDTLQVANGVLWAGAWGLIMLRNSNLCIQFMNRIAYQSKHTLLQSAQQARPVLVRWCAYHVQFYYKTRE